MNRIVLAAALLAFLSGCASVPADGYERHSRSRLVNVPGSGSEFIFEAGQPPVAPDRAEADPETAAEAVRMRWLSEWLTLRGVCAAGHEIVDRRPFGPYEYNPMGAEYRYLVRCRAAPATEAGDN